MSVRLLIAVFSTLLEEAVLAVIVLVALPRIGIEVSLDVLIALMVALAGFAIFIYRMGSRALRRKPVLGLPDMIGSKGKALSPLALEGFVRIKNELWESKAEAEEIDIGEEVIVVGQDALKLIVRKSGPGDFKSTG